MNESQKLVDVRDRHTLIDSFNQSVAKYPNTHVMTNDMVEQVHMISVGIVLSQVSECAD
jgi:hypothetical protein